LCDIVCAEYGSVGGALCLTHADVLKSPRITIFQLCSGAELLAYFTDIIKVLTDIADTTTLVALDPVAFQFRHLAPTDGMALHRLVSDCPPLDPNSSYCNLLQASHFSSTSLAAVYDNELLGSVTGYLVPDRPDTLFVWQVAVHPKARGKRLARTMLTNLFARVASRGVRFIETSITSENSASWRLFTGFAAEYGAEMQRSVMFDQSLHFQGAHDTEHLVRIGPVESK